MKRFVTFLGLVLLYSSLSHAALTINVVESGGDVVATASGTLNTLGLNGPGTGTSPGGVVRGTNSIVGTEAIFTGNSGQALDVYTGFVNPSLSYSTGNVFTSTTDSGDALGFTMTLGGALYVPQGYVPNSPLNSSSTWNGASFASLELISGTYVISWGSGDTADSFTLIIGGVAPPPAYSIEGTVTGLTALGLVLQINGGDDLDVFTNGNFFFSGTMLDDGSAYAVTVLTHPTGQTCSVTNGSGTISGANVTDVIVNCADDQVATYTIGGTVSGLSGSGLVLQNNAGDDLAVAADASFTFATALADGSTYAVTVLTQPVSPAQTCTVGSGSGTLAGADVTDVTVTCADDAVPTYSVGGTLSGLTGTGLELQNNGVDTLAIDADGPFTFLTELVNTTAYAVTVSVQPTGQTCTTSNESGTIATADVTNVSVACIDDVVAPPPVPMVPIPAMSEWALILLTMLLGLMVFANRRRLF